MLQFGMRILLYVLASERCWIMLDLFFLQPRITQQELYRAFILEATIDLIELFLLMLTTSLDTCANQYPLQDRK